MVTVFTILGVVVLSGFAIWFGNHNLRNPGPTSSGGNAFGGFEVFDPGQGRMREELDSKETEGSQFPVDDGDERAVRVDLHTNTVRIRKPTDPPA